MKPFDFTPTFLLSVVNDRFYSVPKYQRSFAWTDDMVGDFWEDMQRAIVDQREHFLGNVVFSEETQDSTRSIIDGQQRIVTTTLLLSAMRSVFADSGEHKAAEAVAAYTSQHES
jgi:uncharacterized protein with ParB-like and HNH nuclease domain